MSDPRETVTFNLGDQRPLRSTGSGEGDLTDELLGTSVWSDEMLESAGIPVVDVPFVSIGGGIGSFALVDYLRIAGVPAEDIKVLSFSDTPYEQYAFLCKNSQIPEGERLRSDSGSTPDNIWGFPAYAVREAWRDKTLQPLWNVLVEPVFAPYWTPRAGTVFRAIEREATRIGWSSCLHKGQVRMVRRRSNGGYFTVLTPSEGTSRTKRLAFRSRYAHIGVGYPALRYLPDLQKYRDTYGDYTRVVNAYEPHEHVYESLRSRPGVVMVRGSGIVASRILQRLIDDRDAAGAQTRILHLFRTYRTQPKKNRKWGFGKQKVKDGWAHQAFNVTKASWGGQHRKKLLELEGEERKEFLDYIGGGAHTPVRRDWQEQLRRGKAHGFYRQHVGVVEDVQPDEGGEMVMTKVRDADGNTTEIKTDFVIDCTGLVGSARDHRVLADMLDHTGARENLSGRLDCGQNFEVTGTASPPGKLYASGAPAAGNYYGGVDSFLGLQYVAQLICDDLAREGFCRRIGPLRSTRHWFKWARSKPL